MATREAEASSSGPEYPGESFSEFLARILDQLSITAWMPSMAFVGAVVVVAHLRYNEGDLGKTLEALGDIGWAALVLIVAAVVVATMTTQAIEFEAIRFLEGYWGKAKFAGWAADKRCNRHRKKRTKLEGRIHKLEKEAIGIACVAMTENNIPHGFIAAVTYSVLQVGTPVPEEDLRRAEKFDWYRYSDPNLIRRRDVIVNILEGYPDRPHRILPTRLGNMLRAFEDRSHRGTGRLEALVIGVFHELPSPLQKEHDRYRNRLDLYTSMVFVSWLAGLASAGILVPLGWRYPVVSILAAGLLGWLSYRAAVTSARKYGIVLEEIGRLA